MSLEKDYNKSDWSEERENILDDSRPLVDVWNAYTSFTSDLDGYFDKIKSITSHTLYLMTITTALVAEVGELASVLQKAVRDKDGVIDGDDIESIKKELGDVFWNISRLLDAVGLDLNDVLGHNIDKLVDRRNRGVIGGSGDDR